MKKTILILSMVFASLFGYSNNNNIKIQNFYSTEKIDSIKSTLNRDGIFIELNLPYFKDKLYLYDTFIKYDYETCLKYETVMFDFESEEKIAVNVLFYKNGITYIVLKNLKTGSLVKYEIK